MKKVLLFVIAGLIAQWSRVMRAATPQTPRQMCKNHPLQQPQEKPRGNERSRLSEFDL